MLSCSSAGVPPTYRFRPFGGFTARSSAIFLAASLRLARPFWITRTEPSLGTVVPFGPGTQGFPAMVGQGRSCQVLSVKPPIPEIRLRMSATCWSVTLLWLSLWITTVSCSVR
ncbi:hypothetical protein PICSAR240_03008 [Mycobacterium avium subsp. paratuberculosis]|nr:hypothetical protein PICSAR10_02118 [Mycobacterium avium subsp. paratuberculosis]CAG6903312.1 hypothetical protein PICSAR120_02775 [Mycobacterium avium subsp. paratuberculosis]CAG6904119.1 hypothetical protein PICSAR119_02835 [Mycobacterium avium subsp. paratuberculosis]CAG6905788.1 hypothetical protein PICSAR118_02948 [Mycobacterium avium subsp. paratuberculosis]CAG6906692.1 hypothetical protein PICSAR107_02922 [Mycobacterium avium subsp. paratuberculosis]